MHRSTYGRLTFSFDHLLLSGLPSWSNLAGAKVIAVFNRWAPGYSLLFDLNILYCCCCVLRKRLLGESFLGPLIRGRCWHLLRRRFFMLNRCDFRGRRLLATVAWLILDEFLLCPSFGGLRLSRLLYFALLGFWSLLRAAWGQIYITKSVLGHINYHWLSWDRIIPCCGLSFLGFRGEMWCRQNFFLDVLDWLCLRLNEWFPDLDLLLRYLWNSFCLYLWIPGDSRCLFFEFRWSWRWESTTFVCLDVAQKRLNFVWTFSFAAARRSSRLLKVTKNWAVKNLRFFRRT